MKRRLKSILGLLLDILYPPVCLACDAPGSVDDLGLCEACLEAIRQSSPACCPRCGAFPFLEGSEHEVPGPTDESPTCTDEERDSGSSSPGETPDCGFCRDRDYSFTGTRAAFAFSHPIDAVIRRFKYSHAPSLGRALGRSMSSNPRIAGFLEDVDLLISVPLHATRKRERGYNQSRILAAALGEIFGIAVHDDVLERLRYTRSQTELSWEERLANVRGAFGLKNPRRMLDGKTVVLIDDVFTTGATIDACARTLLDGGAGGVRCITAAWAVMWGMC